MPATPTDLQTPIELVETEKNVEGEKEANKAKQEKKKVDDTTTAKKRERKQRLVSYSSQDSNDIGETTTSRRS